MSASGDGVQAQTRESRGAEQLLADLAALTKPRISLMVLITTGCGMWLAPTKMAPLTAFLALLGTVLAVGAANTLNCWLERDLDALMVRTRTRPLPDGRLAPSIALVFGLVQGALAIPLLWFGVNPMTAVLGALALVSYVGIYTPMKTIHPSALLLGSVSGALPPLMGWTAAQGLIELPGILLFAILFLWQLPHFIAIAIYRKQEYDKAGIRVLPAVRGDKVAKLHAILWAAALLPVTVALFMLDIAGPIYLGVALLLGLAYLGASLRGMDAGKGAGWARQLFKVSLVHLPVLLLALVLDAST